MTVRYAPDVTAMRRLVAVAQESTLSVFDAASAMLLFRLTELPGTVHGFEVHPDSPLPKLGRVPSFGSWCVV